MAVTIVGAQLGDEGKGGIVDVLADQADIVVRYQGGDNAGHTVVADGETYKLSLVPSGVVQGTIGVIGNGCVVNLETLFDEIDTLRDRGLDPEVYVSGRAHVIMPYHRALDGAEEDAKAEDDLSVGTTGRGIGPTYEDKMARRGIRVADLLDPDALRPRLEYVVEHKRALAEAVFNLEADEAFDVDELFATFSGFGERLADEGMVVEAGRWLTERLKDGDRLLYEGAQGTILDIDHGNYPYTTSSNPTAGYAATGSGVGPHVIADGEVIGVIKAYLSRVGEGPMPSELDGSLAETIRDRGGEYGTVTGRPRRVGWLDLPMLRDAARASGFSGLALNHLDVLAGLDEVKVAVAYDGPDGRRQTMPATTTDWAACEPVYQSFDGWPDVDWDHVAEAGIEALPDRALAYATFVASEVDVPLSAIGIGPNREQTLVLEHPFESA